MTKRPVKPKILKTANATQKTKTPAKSRAKVTGRPGTAPAEKSSHQRATGQTAPRRIDPRIGDAGDWREATLTRMRALILEADPAINEERKWKKPSNAMAGVPVWSHHGMICTGETYKSVVKLTFAHGASLPDPAGLFNASLEGNTRRAIDLHEGDVIDAVAFQALVQAAVARNGQSAKKKTRSSAKPKAVKLLSGGNPQIAKGDGDAPVQAYIAAMPGWKRAIGHRLDALIVRTIPGVHKAVKWNSPFYGLEGQGWFLGLHCLTKYVKVAFFRGTSLRPVPPIESKQKDVRYVHIHEHDSFDEAQFASWVQQAAALPGEKL